ncbi:MAG TPA: hypothetical protein DCR21_03730, partial [Succinivibrionaceae bacterium]|nr:hypothetical protein [Succinivibrionaceae bacterium]
MRKSCKIGLALLLTPVFLLLLSLFVVIGFISTTSGSSFIVSKVNSLLEGTLSITLDLKEGSLVYGPVTDKPFEVLVNDVVRVSSDTLDLRYNAWDLLFKGSLFIDKLKADNLKVELILPDDDTESEEDSEETVEDEESFRLVFPFPVKLKTLEVDTFAYLSDIIDIQVDNIRANLEIRDSFASVNTLSTDNVLVHLKDDDWEDEEETASDTAAAIENVAALDLQKVAGKVTAEGKETAAAASAVTGADTKATSENSHSRAFITRAREGVNSVIDSLIEGLKEIISDTLGVLGFNGGEHGEIERLVTVDLPLDANIGELKAGKVRYYMSNYDTGEISDVEVSAFWNHTLLSVGKVRASHPLGKVAVKGSMNFDEYFTLNFDVSGEGECSEYTKTEYEGALYGLKGSAAVTGSLVDLNLNARITEPQEILVRGRLNCLSSALPSELEVSTRKLVYPFKNAFEDSEKTQLEADAQPESVSEDNWQATADRALNENSSIEDSDKVKAFAISSEQEKITLSDFSLKSEGPIMGDMKVRLEGRLEGYGLENAMVELDCKVSLARALINKLSVDGSYQGAPFNVAYRGLTDYSSDVLLDGRLAASASDLEDLNDLLSGKGELLTDFLFRYQLESDNIQFKVRSIDGNLILNGKQLLLTGRDLVGDLAQGYNLGSFRVTQGRNLVDLHGMVGEKSDLVGNLSLKALEDLAPGLKGNLIGRVRARNSITSPDLSMLIRSKGLLRYEDMMASDLSVNASLSASEGRIGVTVVSEYLKLAKGLKPSRKCALDLSGTLAKHRLSLNCGGNNGGYIGAEGSYSEQDKIWQGSLKDLIFVSQYTDPVSLKDKVEINIDTENMSGSLSAFEIGGEMGSLQVGKTEFGSGRISTTVDLPNLDISKLTRYLPNAVMRGSASLHADIDMIDGVPDIKAQVQANRNFFSMASFALGIDKALVEASFTGSQIKAHTALDLFRNRGRLEADINLSDPYEARKLSGNIDLTELDLGLFQALGNAFNELKGTASVHGSLGGDLSMPLFNGTVSAKGSA